MILPNYLTCSPRAVTAFLEGNGVRFVARPEGDRGAFIVGQIEAERFVRTNPLGREASIVADDPVSFTVADASGNVVAACRG